MRAQKEVGDAQAFFALEGVVLIVPEPVALRLRMQNAEGVGEAEIQQFLLLPPP